jgi:hypothetical protein
VNAVVQPYCHVLQDRRHQARWTTLIFYFKKKSEKPPNYPNMAKDDPVNFDNPQPGLSSRQQRLYIYILLQNRCDIQVNPCT